MFNAQFSIINVQVTELQKLQIGSGIARINRNLWNIGMLECLSADKAGWSNAFLNFHFTKGFFQTIFPILHHSGIKECSLNGAEQMAHLVVLLPQRTILFLPGQMKLVHSIP